MTYGLPPSTERRMAVPKERFFAKVRFTGAEKERFDALVHRMTVTNIISPESVNLEPAPDTGSIFVEEVQLNDPDYDERILDTLDRLGHRTVYVMSYGDRRRLAVVEGTRFQSKWVKEDEIKIELVGLDLGEVWRNLVRSIGGLEDAGDFADTIERTVRNEQIRKQIDALEKKLAKEKQNHVQRELFAQIQELRKQMR